MSISNEIPASAAPSSSRIAQLPQWLPWAIALVGVSLTILLWNRLTDNEEKLISAQFEADSEERVEAIKRQFGEHLGAAYALMAFYAGSEKVEPDEFADFTAPLLKHYRNVESLVWLPRITQSTRATHEEAARAVHRNYVIRHRDENRRLVPAANREVYFPIFYLASGKRNNSSLIGFDWASRVEAFAALRKAADEGSLQVTAPIEWLQGTGRNIHVLVFAPVYKQSLPRGSISERRSALDGLVACHLNVSQIVQDAVSLLADGQVDLYLVDPAAAPEKQLLYTDVSAGSGRVYSRVSALADAVESHRGRRSTLVLENREWTVYSFPTSGYVRRRQSWWTHGVLIGGLLLTAFAVGGFMVVARRAGATEQLARDLTITTSDLEQALESQKKATRANEKMAAERATLASDLQQALDEQRAARGRIEELANKIWEAVEQLSAASTEILGTSSMQASSAQQQANAVRETVATVEEVTQCAHATSEHANSVADSARRSREVAESGNSAVERSNQAMNNVQKEMQAIENTILGLAEKAQVIGEIIATVNDVTERTNLLALNAAIEASRAGEHGKGFTVVANEVKALAEESKKGTAQINQILNEIRDAANTAAKLADGGSKAVAAAGEVIAQADKTISTLSQTITDSARLATKIVASASEQVTGMSQVSQAIHNIDEATRQTLFTTQQTELAAEKLTELGQQLRHLIQHDPQPQPSPISLGD